MHLSLLFQFTALFPKELKTLAGLIEDNSIATRAYALRTLLAMGALDFENLKLIAFATVARLDDPSSEVREMAARCLGRLQLGPGANDDDDESSNRARWEETLKPIISTMFLHLENPELKLRAAILGKMKSYFGTHDLLQLLPIFLVRKAYLSFCFDSLLILRTLF